MRLTYESGANNADDGGVFGDGGFDFFRPPGGEKAHHFMLLLHDEPDGLLAAVGRAGVSQRHRVTCRSRVTTGNRLDRPT